MIRTNGRRGGFTLVELLVVVSMIAILMGALTTSVTAAQNRARIQRATNDVKVITQAILGYENYSRSGSGYSLPTMERADADSGSIGFLIGRGSSSAAGGDLPVLLMASLQGGGKMLDPWGQPYKITIRDGGGSMNVVKPKDIKAIYSLPNYYRLGADERDLVGGKGAAK